jgi:branched-chain amino acid transport system permease protein
MTISLLLFQLLNGLQYGVMISLLAAGLTLIFGILNVVNLAHGSLYMIGAYSGATVYNYTNSFGLAVVVAISLTAIIGLALERLVISHLYKRDHLDQILVTIGLILIFNEAARMGWGVAPYYMTIPEVFDAQVSIFGIVYPSYRLLILAVGLLFAAISYFAIHYTRMGMLVRAGAQDAEICAALGVNVRKLNALIFAVGAGLAGIAGVLASPIISVEPTMGENMLILAIIVIVIGGFGSMKGAFFASVIVGLIDTVGRIFLPIALSAILPQSSASAAGPAIASMLIYILMAVVLVWRPDGLFPVRGR